MDADGKESSLSNASPTPTLDYAQRPPLAWVSRHRRILIFLALCFAIIGPIWWYWSPLKTRVLWLYWTRQAAAHRMPEKSVDLFIRDPAKAIKTSPPILATWPIPTRLRS